MATTFQYTAPLVPTTSFDVLTITQTLTRLGKPITTTSFTTLTTLTLTKSLPTPTDSPQSGNQSSVAPSTIGAIVGSILGFIILATLIYCCCFRTSSGPEDDPEAREPKEEPRYTTGRIEKRTEPTGETTLVKSRPRRKKRGTMGSYPRQRTPLYAEREIVGE